MREYTSNGFLKYCSEERIKKEHIVPHTPQKNGAERKNKTMVGATKAMLFDQGLPIFLWAEAYMTAVYIQSSCTHTSLGRKTPKEVFTGTRLDADTRKKPDPSGAKGLLVGYSETSKAYRVYIPAHKRIIVSRDV